MTAAINHALLYGYPTGNDQFTKALLHCEGADASTTFTNSAAGGSQAFTAVGNAQIDTAQFKFGAASGLFDGTGDGITGGGSADFAFGTGDFTIDLWLRPNSVAGTTIFYDSRPLGTQGLYPTIYLNGATLRYLTNSADRITGTTSLSTGTWYHIAVARAGTSTKLFLNGTQEGSTYSDSNNYLNGASRPAIGANGNAASNDFNGWLDEIRITKGLARWTSNFTPWGKAYG